MSRRGLYAIAFALCLAAAAGIVTLLVADSLLIELHLAIHGCSGSSSSGQWWP